MASELVRQLVDAGIHFGHRTSRWNPKMKRYIYGKRKSIHIVDIRETVKGLLRARRFLSQVVANGRDVLFVGTKRQARQIISSEAQRVDMHYVSERWLGGTLTNFRTIRSRLARLEELEAIEANGNYEQYSKKMVATLKREKSKMTRNLQGIRRMTRLPGALFVVDVRREHIALKEARKLGIPTVCLIDTDSDPDYADIPIPGNDDAMRAIAIIVGQLAGAIAEGKRAQPEPTAEQEQAPDAAQARRRTRRGVTARATKTAAETSSADATDSTAQSSDSAAQSESTEAAPPADAEQGLSPSGGAAADRQPGSEPPDATAQESDPSSSAAVANT